MLIKAIKVYTSFEVGFSGTPQPRTASTSSVDTRSGSKGPPSPALVSIVALQPRGQARFFCPAELKSSEPATLEEEAHVQEFFKVISIVAAFRPDNGDGRTPEFDINPV